MIQFILLIYYYLEVFSLNISLFCSDFSCKTKLHFAAEAYSIFQYCNFWTVDKMYVGADSRKSPSAVQNKEGRQKYRFPFQFSLHFQNMWNLTKLSYLLNPLRRCPFFIRKPKKCRICMKSFVIQNIEIENIRDLSW